MAWQVERACRYISAAWWWDGQYEVTIQNLDGPATFQGTAVGDQVTFERNGVKETIRASNGVETGMKWLSEKSDCLTVRPGEGCCRD